MNGGEKHDRYGIPARNGLHRTHPNGAARCLPLRKSHKSGDTQLISPHGGRLTKHTMSYDRIGRPTDHYFGSDDTGNVHRLKWEYRYDDSNAGRITGIASSNDDGLSAGSTAYAYEAHGRLSRVTLRNGAYTDYFYDRGGRPTRLANYHSAYDDGQARRGHPLRGKVCRPGGPVRQSVSRPVFGHEADSPERCGMDAGATARREIAAAHAGTGRVAGPGIGYVHPLRHSRVQAGLGPPSV